MTKSKNPLMRVSDGVSLHEHLEQLLEEMNRRLDERFCALEKALSIADDNANKWRDNANEWRAAMNDREASFVRKQEATIVHDNMLKRIDDLEKMRDIAQGKASQTSVIIAGIGSIIGILLGLIHLFKQ